MQVTITAISRKDKTSKAGKPFVSLGLKTREHGEKWLSGFGNVGNRDWKIGDTVDIDIEQKGDFLNFTMAKNDNGTDKPARVSADTSLVELKNLISLKVIPMLERIEHKLDGDGYPDRDDSTTPTF